MLKCQIGVRINPLNGYINLDAAAQPGESDRIHCDPMDIDPLVDPNELSELIIAELLDYLPLPARQKCLQHLITRVSHGGKVIIIGNDLQEVCRLGHSGQLNASALNSIIYGIGKKSSVSPAENIQLVLSSGQFDLDEVKYSQQLPYQYTIIVRRK